MKYGIDSRVVSGDVPGIENSAHAWNQVKIDGVWYNLDLTWDASRIRSGEELEYFLINDEEFYKKHRVAGNCKIISDYISDECRNYREYYDSESPNAFVCSKTYDKSIIAQYFKSKITPKQSKEMIEEVSEMPTTMQDINREMQTIVDVEKTATQIVSQEMEVSSDER
jgi:transglutaminase-like putative cysteine protease